MIKKMLSYILIIVLVIHNVYPVIDTFTEPYTEGIVEKMTQYESVKKAEEKQTEENEFGEILPVDSNPEVNENISSEDSTPNINKSIGDINKKNEELVICDSINDVKVTVKDNNGISIPKDSELEINELDKNQSKIYYKELNEKLYKNKRAIRDVMFLDISIISDKKEIEPQNTVDEY